MNGTGPILILEDDEDDREIFELIFAKLGEKNERRYFTDSEDFLDYLKITQEKPLIILSDVNMAKANGIQLKKQIEDNPFLKGKTIPYVFITTYGNPSDIKTAYNLQAQGFFIKSAHFTEMVTVLGQILGYWRNSLHPNNI